MYELTLKDFYYKIKGDNLVLKELLFIKEKDIKLLDKYNINGKDYIVNEIGDEAFSYLNIANIELPDTIKKIGNYAFLNSKIENFKFPQLVKKIPEGCFWKCNNLKNIILNDNIKLIDNGAFYGTGIEKFICPKDVKIIPLECFFECNNLKEIILNNDISKFNSHSFADTCIKNFTIPPLVTEIPEDCFCGCDNLKKINLNNVKLIHSNAFNECFELNIFYQNDIDIYIDNYDELKEKGFNEEQISQIFKGYEKLIFLNDLPIDTPVDVFNTIIKNFEVGPKMFVDIINKLKDKKLNLHDKLDLYNEINKLSNYMSLDNKDNELII